MESRNYLSVQQCCVYYEIEESFLQALNDHGLLELTKSGDEIHVGYEQLDDLERFIHLHFDLDINIEGIESITHLLNRVRDLQNQITQLRHVLGHG